MPPSNSQPPVVTRFAPSPTGHLHIGGARTALFCWAFARRHGGHFILRIEDTDQARSSDESARGIMEDLAWLGIDWDEGPVLRTQDSGLRTEGRTIGGDPRGVGPFFQARRVHLYNQQVLRLVEEGKAYPAFETPEELEAQRKKAVAAKQTYRYDRASWERVRDIKERLRLMERGEVHVVRFFAPAAEVVVRDEVLGDVRYGAGEMDDFVIRKADGFPTYHFAVVVDDELMGVTHVLRAQEHLNNTPRHVALQKALSFRTPVYAHMPLIFNMDGTKMSKRDKAKAARAALKAAMQKDAALTPAAAAAKLGLDAGLVSGFLAQENDSLEVAEAIAAHFRIALPEVEVSDFRDNGYLPEAITNFLSLLGWNPGMKTPDGKDLEKFDMAFVAQHFGIERIGRTNARFDRAKLLAFNADAIGAMRDEAFAARWREWCLSHEPGLVSRLDAARWLILARAVKARAKTMRDGVKAAAFVLRDDASTEFDRAAVEKNLLAGDRSGLKVLAEFRGVLEKIEPFEPAAINAAIENLAKGRGFGMGAVAQPIRVAIAGSPVSPPLGETLAVLGKQAALTRIQACERACAGA
jgi:glutamyl-tRNA synthetase